MPADRGAAAERPRARLHVAADLAAGVPVALDAAQAHYLTHVLRLGPEAPVALFNGRDGEWLARIASVGKRRCVIEPVALRRPQASGADVWLLFAPVKRQPLDLMVRQATELGASRLQPVLTRHTVAERVNVERLRAIAIEAAEQCERLDLPEVGAPQPLAQALADWPAGRRLILCDESGGGPPLAPALRALAPSPAALLTGPEGGFAPAELDALRDLDFVTAVGLGPRILRAETAALSALAVWQALHGDGAQPPPARAHGSARSAPGPGFPFAQE